MIRLALAQIPEFLCIFILPGLIALAGAAMGKW